MTETKILVERLEANRRHLRSVAYRMLGSQAEADDAVQETFLRVMRATATGVDNFTGWLTTIVARVCLDMLRERKSRREVPVDAEVEAIPATDDVEREKQIADSVVEASVRTSVPGLAPEIRGCDSVAKIFRGRAKAAQLALVDGEPGLVFTSGGQPRMVVKFAILNDRIVEINLIADPGHVAACDLHF